MTNGRPSGPARASVYAALALAAAMLIGGAAGFAIGRSVEGGAPSYRKEPALSDMTLLGLSRASLLDSLEPSPSQRVLIDSLLDDAARRAESAVDGLVTDVRAITADTRRQVRSALDDRQRARFDSILNAIPPLLPRTPVPPRRP